jgi:hypothetical protein
MTNDPELRRDIRELLSRDLGLKARAFQQLKRGRNSRVFRVDCDDGSAVAVKAYFKSPHDPRDRLGCEVRALRFLRSEGLRDLPAPLAVDAARGIAAYEFADGQPLQPGQASDAEVDQAVEFLRALKVIADSGRAGDLSPASEACFSIAAILDNLGSRFRRLDQAAAGQPDLADFLHDEILPFRKLAEQHSRDFCREHGIATDAEIPLSARTLSPSDFGFHNALRRADGRLVFLDFEYFGWDDPAKTVADFCLHPAMHLPSALKRRFFSGMMAALPGVPELPHRVRAVYPLFGLKWCAILLNEFTLDDVARRCFAAGKANRSRSKKAQLEKARRMLAQVKNDCHDFPGHS